MSKSILFLTKYPRSSCLKDGYFQRVFAIDKVLTDFDRYYVDYASFRFIPLVKKINSNIFEIQTCKYNPLGLLLVLFYAYKSDAVYLHSILRLNSVFHKVVFLLAKKRIIDLHGVVPEELEYYGSTELKNKFDKIENFALHKADIVIGVTKKMIDYVTKKHDIKKNVNFIILPILPQIKDIFRGVIQKNINSVIYCGGLQKWQQVDKMFEFVHENKEINKFAFLVSEFDKLIEEYGNKYSEDFPGVVKSVESHLVNEWYAKYAFGLVLREDMIVNNAACPTKLIEYFQNDVVPIVDSENIGDFKELGYVYIKYKDELPSEEEWKKMVMQNREVLKKIYSMFKENSEKLKSEI